MIDVRAYVVHCKKAPYDVYIGRPGEWGNPFVIGKDGTREEVVKKFEHSLSNEMKKRIREELKGQVLGCFCDPLLCHGHVLARIANEPRTEDFW